MAKEIQYRSDPPKMKFLDEKGNELPDPNPMEIPAGFKRPETLAEQVRRLVRSQHLADAAESQGFETFDESNDFEIDDDMFDPSSPYEEVFDPVLGRGITQDEFHRNEAEYRRRFMEAEQRAYQEMDRSEALRARPRTPSPPAPPAEPQAPPSGGSGPKAG